MNYSQAFLDFCAWKKVEPTELLWSAWSHGALDQVFHHVSEMKVGSDLVRALENRALFEKTKPVTKVPAIVGNPLTAFTVKEFSTNFLERSEPREL